MGIDVSTESPWVAIVLGVLGIAGTAVSAFVASSVKRASSSAKENIELKHELMVQKISAVRTEILNEVGGVKRDLHELGAKMDSSLSDIAQDRDEWTRRTAAAINAVKNVVQRGETKFEIFQTELKNLHLIVDRIIKRSGNGK